MIRNQRCKKSAIFVHVICILRNAENAASHCRGAVASGLEEAGAIILRLKTRKQARLYAAG